jgi:hypothetical protein
LQNEPGSPTNVNNHSQSKSGVKIKRSPEKRYEKDSGFTLNLQSIEPIMHKKISDLNTISPKNRRSPLKREGVDDAIAR